jgi:hypothetical protein
MAAPPPPDLDQAFARALQVTEKFDYFVAGIAIALVAYIGQNFEASEMNVGNALEFAALVAFFVSSFSGVFRLEGLVESVDQNFGKTRSGTLCLAYGEGLRRAQAPDPEEMYVEGTKVPFEEISARLEAERAKMQAAEARMAVIRNQTGSCRKVRDWALILGLGLLVLGRSTPLWPSCT